MKKIEPIDTYEVVKAVKGVLYLGTDPMTEIEVANLKQEVRALRTFRIWRIMQETVRQQAIERGVITSENWEHVLSAKAMLFDLDILRNIVTAIDTYSIPQIAPPKKRTGIPLP